MPYEPAWEGLLDAVERIMTSRGGSREQLQADLCRAISDGVMEIRVQLDRHAHRPQTSSSVVSATKFEIPTDLEPSDLDWQESRPTAPWWLRELERHQSGQWHLKRIEVSREDVTKIFLQGGDAAPATVSAGPIGAPRRRERRRSKQVAAENALREVYGGIPSREQVFDRHLIASVGEQMRRNGIPAVSDDTILRAAGRRR
jgi:hypothetical protein